MDDLDKLIEKRKKLSPQFSKKFDKGFGQFKIDVLLKEARIDGACLRIGRSKVTNKKVSDI